MNKKEYQKFVDNIITFNSILVDRLMKTRKRNRAKTRIIFLILFFWVIREVFCQTKVTASVYNAVAEQCNEDYMHTAFMFKLDTINPFKHRIIAVSRDLLTKYPKGTKVRLKGTIYDGTYIVMDKMNKRFTNRIDILINKDMNIGFWEEIIITKLK